MGIEVQLRRESGETVAEVGDPNMVLSRATTKAFSETRLLKYLTPWCDAVFTQVQAADLADDIRIIKNAHINTPLSELLSAVEPLVYKLSRETHLYLWFVGD